MLRLATVGCGYFSQFHHQAWHRLPIHFVGVCDRDKSLADSFAKRFGIADSFDDFELMLDTAKPDLVDIILPPNQHLACIAMAARRGISVICQKPFTQNLEEAERAVALADKAGISLIVHENFRFQPWYQKIKSILDSDALGQVYRATFNLRPGDGQGPTAYMDRQPYFQHMPQFLMKETGVHFVDVFRYLFGQPTNVYADLRTLNPAIKGEDAGFFSMDFSSGVQAVFDGNRLVDHAAENCRLTMGEMTIESENGTLYLNGNGELTIRQHGMTYLEPVECTFDPKTFGGDCVYSLQRHVLLSLEADHDPDNTAKKYLPNLILLEAIYLSNEEGQRINLQKSAAPQS
ncbi:MAG: Gfo/Idh/MocA family oxidoreductase [Granulosicoccus sp.]|nr:Gfo/Idh/MocA family oxidoreductase [Granulosicoccus sp.]